MNCKRVGFGLLGAGMIAPAHADAIKNAPNAKLVAICDVNSERLDKLTGEFGGKGYNSLEEMLKDSDIQVVNITTPSHLHYDAFVRCALAGKHTLVEKPPAMSLREVDGMIAIGKENAVYTSSVLQLRNYKPTKALRTAIAQGRFGKLLQTGSYMRMFRDTDYYLHDPWRSSRRSGAGVTIQQAFHYIDLQQYLIGSVKSVYAEMANMIHPEVDLEDTLSAVVNYQNGAQGVIQASTCIWPEVDFRLEVYGENGTAIIVGNRIETWTFKDDRPEDEEIRNFGNEGNETSQPSGHQVIVEDMADAVINNRPPAIPLESVRPTLELALAMYQSAKLGTSITLPIVNEETIWG